MRKIKKHPTTPGCLENLVLLYTLIMIGNRTPNFIQDRACISSMVYLASADYLFVRVHMLLISDINVFVVASLKSQGVGSVIGIGLEICLDC